MLKPTGELTIFEVGSLCDALKTAVAEEALTRVPSADPEAFALALARVARAFLTDFPENVFWDFDRLAASMASDPRGPAAFAEDVVHLSALYGRHSTICFRYIHDFVYGFDWCRWVQKDPEGRAKIGPFHPVFLAYLRHRAAELLRLIAGDDEKYGRLRQPYRNPFGFSREPGDEERLHRALAERGLIPVRAWEQAGPDRWNEPFADLREQLAQTLAIGRGPKP